jgi:hypothetical protein
MPGPIVVHIAVDQPRHHEEAVVALRDQEHEHRYLDDGWTCSEVLLEPVPEWMPAAVSVFSTSVAVIGFAVVAWVWWAAWRGMTMRHLDGG